ncbi:endo-1,4-beta-xylanase [Fontivita pretiosa]|uniref:endo-1,4-beta-xylanase n=1 Tax=Fontivita pretiosa TaxID=2989684 RepID=UPI003D18201B
MMHIVLILLFTACGLIAAPAPTTDIDAAAMVFKSTGQASGNGWTLEGGGYIGTYLRLEQAGQVRLTVRASGKPGTSLGLAVADFRSRFFVTDRENDYLTSLNLPPGTYFLRIELPPPAADRSLSIHRLHVEGAAVLNDASDATALAAADSYIEHFRRGRAEVAIEGVPPGTNVRVRLRRHAFNFGGVIHGFTSNEFLRPDPPPGSDAEKFQQFVRSHFNMLVPSNGGKWQYNEKERDVVTMQFVDQCLSFAERNGMRSRMHALLWDFKVQQPKWVNELLARALDTSDPQAAEAARQELMQEIRERIEYYVRDRARRYVELDVLNEPYHEPDWWKALGPQGIAEVFRWTDDAVKQAGANTRLYLNEYNVFQWSSLPRKVSGQQQADPDPYANWYRELYERILALGGPVSGVGIQYYVDKRPDADRGSPHSAAHLTRVLQNLSVVGLPISLTEFGIKPDTPPDVSADVLEDTMRIIFGTPQEQTFVMFGFWGGSMWDQAPSAALVDKDWTLTPVGQRYQQLMKRWNTDMETTVGEDGKVRFVGFYGDYDVVVGDRILNFTHVRDKDR